MQTPMKSGWRVGILGLLLACACGHSPTSPSTSSLSAGRWAGTTAQGAPITFVVSSDEMLTTLSVGYNFNGCSGTQTFSNLNVPTAPDVQCVPGPCSASESAYRAISYSSGSRGTGPTTTINGVFLPGNRAEGLVFFDDFPGYGTAARVEWSATRR